MTPGSWPWSTTISWSSARTTRPRCGRSRECSNRSWYALGLSSSPRHPTAGWPSPRRAGLGRKRPRERGRCCVPRWSKILLFKRSSPTFATVRLLPSVPPVIGRGSTRVSLRRLVLLLSRVLGGRDGEPGAPGTLQALHALAVGVAPGAGGRGVGRGGQQDSAEDEQTHGGSL